MTTEIHPPPFSALDDDALVRIDQVIPGAINVGKSTFYRWIQQGTAPAPVHPGGGAAVWHVGTLREWIRSRVAVGQSDAARAAAAARAARRSEVMKRAARARAVDAAN